ncbi:MAG: hypothetical protein SYC29_12070, partial [Planctomycetota bacterium]|nr:hypothetical protein [Planctomycetota bacterium]
MTWKRDLATWTLGAALLAILLPLTPAAAAAPQAATPAARSGMPGAAEEKPVPLIAKGDKKDKGKSPGKS